MLNDEQILALKERSEKHGDLWMRGASGDVCLRVSSVLPLTKAASVFDPEQLGPRALLVSGQAVPLRNANITDFVTVTSWTGSVEPSNRDNLTLLQDAALGGLDVNFMTGDVKLPAGLMPSAGSAQ